MGADSLGFLSVDGLVNTPVGGLERGFCTGCFTGEYPINPAVEDLPAK